MTASSFLFVNKITFFGKNSFNLNKKGDYMQISKTENVIFMKDIQSNMIDQAFIILKDNIKINFEKSEEKNKEEINIIKDAENIINNEIEKYNIKFEKFKNELLSKKINTLKITNIITVVMLILSILIR